jgi:hypothetical protein
MTTTPSDDFTALCQAGTKYLALAVAENPRAPRSVRRDCYIILGDEARWEGAWEEALAYYQKARGIHDTREVAERMARAHHGRAAQRRKEEEQ